MSLTGCLGFRSAGGSKTEASTAGTAGAEGAQGLQGPRGETGPQGPKGDTGAQGPKGDTGAQGPPGTAAPASLYRTSDGGELVSALQVTSGTAVFTHIFSLCVGITSGKTADVRAQTEITNDLGYNVGIGYVLAAYDYNSANQQVYSKYLVPPVMTNITPAVHHGVFQTTGIEIMAPVAGSVTRCYTLTAWAVSTAAGGGASVRVEPGYGHLTVVLR